MRWCWSSCPVTFYKAKKMWPQSLFIPCESHCQFEPLLMTTLIQYHSRLFFHHPFCPAFQPCRCGEYQHKTQIKNVTQWLCIECPLCGRRNEIFNKISGESYLFIYFFHKKMSTQLHPHRHTHSLRVISLHPGIVTNGRKSHLLLQAVTITEKIYCRKLVNSISAGGPEMIYQRFRDLRQHFTSFIQMLWANKIMIKPLATFVSCAFWQDYC